MTVRLRACNCEPERDTGAPFVSDQDFWDERYRSRTGLWSGQPNPQLVADVARLAPGTALDIGCGEGADAIWLAQRGWQVTGMDLSPVALERAATHAAAAGTAVAARVMWALGDLVTWNPAGQFDLVSMHFIHVPPAARETFNRRAATFVAPGGSLLIVGHDAGDRAQGVRRPPGDDQYFSGDDVVALLDLASWDIVVNEVRPRTVTRPDDVTVTIHDVVVRALCRPS